MSIRFLINDDGAVFGPEEVASLRPALGSLDLDERKNFRDGNAEAVATHPAGDICVVAGPGTGKSTLFKRRILFWLKQNPDARILALSFVRKLVADLNSDIRNDNSLTERQKGQVEVHTLHKYARSVVERNGGAGEWKFAPHFKVIGQDWKKLVWNDVLLLSGQPDVDQYSWKAFERQLHDDEFSESEQWKSLKKTYFTLCRFYNAAGFGDLILRAQEALVENPGLNAYHYFIIDEYQDFNTAEEHLLEQIAAKAAGRLIVGDDDQVLYETLKSGRASLIRAIYSDPTTVNAMLPFCGRCDFYITRAASHFIDQSPDANAIKKIYLPMSGPDTSQKVQVVACATPATAVDYIRRFIEDHTANIQQRKKELKEGMKKDAYLLILSPSHKLNFYRLNDAREKLLDLIRPFQENSAQFSNDYLRVLNYYSLANYPRNNFAFRKVLFVEGVPEAELLSLLNACVDQGTNFADTPSPSVETALDKAKRVRGVIDSKEEVAKKVEALCAIVAVDDPALLQRDLEAAAIDAARVDAIEHQEEEDAELEELEIRRMPAVELMSIVGAKGLSADHVIVVGFDDVNMQFVTRNAFYVAMTRARRSLHLLTALKAGGATGPGGFLEELPDNDLEFSSYKKAGGRTLLAARAKLSQYFERLKFVMRPR